MSDLPQSSSSSNPPPTPADAVGGMAKETGPHIGFVESPLITEIGQEQPLPPEVSKAGVTLQPQTVTLPPNVSQMGVKVVGSQTPPVQPQAITVALPISDDQIAAGLQQSLTTSLRWLSEWCVRQLKQAHVILKSVHGKIIRSNT